MAPSSKPAAEPGTPEFRNMEPLCAVFRRKLKSLGQKYTPERAQILDAIVRWDGMFEAEELQERLAQGGFRVSKATVYRTLRLLQDSGIIRRVLVSDEQSHYQLVYGGEVEDFLVIVGETGTTRIHAPELAQLRDRICKERGLEPRGHSFCVFAARPADPATRSKSPDPRSRRA